MNPEAAAINQITQDLIDREGEEMSVTIHEFMKFVGDCPMIAYNVSFDRWFLEREMADHGISTKLKYECALQAARKAFPDLKNHKLVTVASHLGVNTEGAHRALQDCLMTLHVYIWSKTIIGSRKAEADTKLSTYVVKDNNELSGKVILFTGRFTGYTRREIQELASMVGMDVKTSYSKKVDIVVAGEKPGETLTRAESHGKRIMDELEFLTLIRSAISIGDDN